MIDLKYEEMEMKDFVTPKADKPKYPMGMQLRLGPKELQKLGIKEAPQVGKEMKLHAMVEVIEVRQQEETGDVDEYSVVLQVKEVDFEKKEEEREESTSSMLYGG